MTTCLEKKGKSTRCGSYDQIGKAVFYWFIGERSQKVPIDGIMLKEKALEFAKTLGIKEFKASDCWLSKWKKRYKYNNSFLFALFCTTLNCIVLHFVLHLPSCFLQRISTIFLGPEIFNLQGTCIPSSLPRLNSLPVMTTLHSASWSALRK